MKINFKTGVWKVYFTEYERGWGQKKFKEDEFYSTEDEAKAVVAKFNAGNDKDYVPDWYAVAEYKKVI